MPDETTRDEKRGDAMTIYQLRERCWILDPGLAGDDYQRHYDTRADAEDAVREAERDEYPDPVTLAARVSLLVRRCRAWVTRRRPRPRQFGAPCWVIQCDGECEQLIDEEDEGYIEHHDSRADAQETVRAWDWVYSGDGPLVFCQEDGPGDGQPPPLSPAEQEAAGQLVIPGVIP